MEKALNKLGAYLPKYSDADMAVFEFAKKTRILAKCMERSDPARSKAMLSDALERIRIAYDADPLSKARQELLIQVKIENAELAASDNRFDVAADLLSSASLCAADLLKMIPRNIGSRLLACKVEVECGLVEIEVGFYDRAAQAFSRAIEIADAAPKDQDLSEETLRSIHGIRMNAYTGTAQARFEAKDVAESERALHALEAYVSTSVDAGRVVGKKVEKLIQNAWLELGRDTQSLLGREWQAIETGGGVMNIVFLQNGVFGVSGGVQFSMDRGFDELDVGAAILSKPPGRQETLRLTTPTKTAYFLRYLGGHWWVKEPRRRSFFKRLFGGKRKG